MADADLAAAGVFSRDDSPALTIASLDAVCAERRQQPAEKCQDCHGDVSLLSSVCLLMFRDKRGELKTKVRQQQCRKILLMNTKHTI
ncbi:hypothetical protein JOB18_025220 [Solea senegalensis]|uniref:Uncharacterized protein n=1 Tax=Solea senegalensis TaxID=28829 RepID=A0AAV6SML0_SOLSE|nr:hypothetical protein JOB18_025220 [Solea senegalensis]